jgi:hypothetical protein
MVLTQSLQCPNVVWSNLWSNLVYDLTQTPRFLPPSFDHYVRFQDFRISCDYCKVRGGIEQ